MEFESTSLLLHDHVSSYASCFNPRARQRHWTSSACCGTRGLRVFHSTCLFGGHSDMTYHVELDFGTGCSSHLRFCLNCNSRTPAGRALLASFFQHSCLITLDLDYSFPWFRNLFSFGFPISFSRLTFLEKGYQSKYFR